MAAFSVIDVDLGKAAPFIVIAGAALGGYLLVRYLNTKDAAQAQQAVQDQAGAATNQYLSTLEQQAELSQLLGDPGSTGSTGSTAGNSGVTYSGSPTNASNAATATSAIGGTVGSAIANPSPSGLLWFNNNPNQATG